MLKIFENNQFILLSDEPLDEELVIRMINYLNNRLSIILDFLKLDSFKQVVINIFLERENFIKASLDRISISSYGRGFCYNDEIFYFIDKEHLKDFTKCGYDIASICHEMVHLVYNSLGHNNIVWLDEGIATYLSGQKSFIENDIDKYNTFLNTLRNSELPPLLYLEKHGSNYGEFCDYNTNKYNGYDISYAFIRFLIDKYGKDVFLNKLMSGEIEDKKDSLYIDFVKKLMSECK